MTLSHRATPYILLTPFLTLFLLFAAYPIAQSLILSLQQTFGPGYARWIGLSNYRWLIADPLFWTSVRNTVLFTLGSVFIQLPLSLALALLLNRERLRGRAIYRTIFFAPSLVGIIFVAMMFSLIFEKRTGLLNRVLHTLFGWDLDFPWLFDYSMPALILAALWMFVGFNMVYFLAALQNVRKELIEASIIDGAGPVSRFRHVILPAIIPIGSFVTLLSIVGSFQLFELPWVMLRGEQHDIRSYTLVVYLYNRGFEIGDLGYASAVGWVLAAVLMLMAVLQRFVSRSVEDIE